MSSPSAAESISFPVPWRSTRRPKSGQPGRYVELEGPPELIVEIVSDASLTKDTQRLPAAYFLAGVPEFWLADARGDRPVFQIHHCAATTFEPVTPDAEGYQPSTAFPCSFHLDAHRDQQGHWTFDLRELDARASRGFVLD